MLENPTYADLMKIFRKRYSEIKVDDYRPSDFLQSTMTVWTKDGRVLLVNYQPSFDYMFILSETTRRSPVLDPFD